MYCPVCGSKSTQGLNYCKQCGAVLSTPAPQFEQRSSFGKMMGMLLPVAAVAVAGFIALFATVFNLGERSAFDSRALIGIMAFGGATVVGVVGLMVWLLLRLTGNEPSTGAAKQPKPVLRDYPVPQLPGPPQAITSVTENTTRNFDPSLYRDSGTHE